MATKKATIELTEKELLMLFGRIKVNDYEEIRKGMKMAKEPFITLVGRVQQKLKDALVDTFDD